MLKFFSPFPFPLPFAAGLSKQKSFCGRSVFTI